MCFFSDGGIPIAYCDVGVVSDSRSIPTLGSTSEKHHHESTPYETKKYPIELKPLFSAFGLKSLAITSVRSFLVFYLPLLEPHPPIEDDGDFPQEAQEERHTDLVVPFKNSIKQIFREVIFSVPCFSFIIFQSFVCYVYFYAYSHTAIPIVNNKLSHIGYTKLLFMNCMYFLLSVKKIMNTVI